MFKIPGILKLSPKKSDYTVIIKNFYLLYSVSGL